LLQLQVVFKDVGDEVPLLPYVGDGLASPLGRRGRLADGRLLHARDGSVNDFWRGRNEETGRIMNETSWNTFSSDTGQGQWPGVDSVYRLIVVAALRNKQLTRGATSRIEADPLRRRNTSIAIEEVKRGLVPFSTTGVQEKSENDASLL
jgi:DNA-directed RNA polymerase omega subunit